MNPGQIFDAYKIMNALAAQAIGNNALTAVDTASFISVGEAVLKTGYENTLNSLGVVLSRTIFSARPYNPAFNSLRVAPDRYGSITRKIIPLYSEAEPSQDVNISGNSGYPSDAAVNNIVNGQSIDMYKINTPKSLQINFYGQQALQKHITKFVHQLDAAFRSEAEFLQYVAVYMVEFFNEIVVLDEIKSRLLLLNRMAGQQAMGLAVVDLIAGYNSENGTQYTREQLLSAEHMTSFMQYLAAEIKIYSSRLKDFQTSLYHANLSGYQPIPRHSPKPRQKMVMYEPIFIKAESQVYSGLFNPTYLEIGSYEGVNFWQSQDNPTAINIKPTILNTTTGAAEQAASSVQIPFVLGLLFDEEALGWTPVFDRTATTPLNAAGLYWNTYYHWLFNAYNDYTENAVLFILGSGGTGEESSQQSMADSMSTIPTTLAEIQQDIARIATATQSADAATATQSADAVTATQSADAVTAASSKTSKKGD